LGSVAEKIYEVRLQFHIYQELYCTDMSQNEIQAAGHGADTQYYISGMCNNDSFILR
jgi:hypothetical protein